MSVQASAASALLTRDPARAAEHLEAVRSSAREGLEEMRRLVGVLREDEPTYAPQPSLDRLGELVADARAAGLPVELDVPEPAPPLPAGLDLAAYRIVQEALTNVRRHAGDATATVLLDHRDDALVVVVDDDGRGAAPGGDGGGNGVAGMAERAAALGGSSSIGPRPDGGYRVRVELPLRPAGSGGAR